MKRAENLNTPLLKVWIFAACAGLLTFLVAKAVGGFNYMPAVFFGSLVTFGVGVFIGRSWKGDVAAFEEAEYVTSVITSASSSVVKTVLEGGSKPAFLTAARGGIADDLKKIEGIGPALEKLCNELGVFHFDQIASWNADEIAWMDLNLKRFKGRVTRDRWVVQAKLIGSVGLEEFQRRVKTNDY